MTIAVESNIPFPLPQKKAMKYPWLEMNVGDSFLIPLGVAQPYSNVSQATVRYAPKKFAARTTPEGLRVWRVA